MTSILMRKRPVARIALCWLIAILTQVAGLSAQAPDAESALRDKYLFLGNKNIPPVLYLDNNAPAGIAADITRAMEKYLTKGLEIRAMDWPEAQRLVATGEADALIQINQTEERLKTYDFSDPLLESHFSIFTTTPRLGISSLTDLAGLRVGVETAGFPRQMMEKNPRIGLVTIPNFLEGFLMLNRGEVDAVVVDYRVGAYVIAEHNLPSIKVTGEPIASSYSAFAVKKGDTALLSEINQALRTIKSEGKYQAIIDAWMPKEVVFQTKGQMVFNLAMIITPLSAMLLVLLILWIVGLRNKLAAKSYSEKQFRDQFSTLTSITNSLNALIFSVDREYRYTCFNTSHAAHMKSLYGVDIQLGRSMLDYLPGLTDKSNAKHYFDSSLAGETLTDDAYFGENSPEKRYMRVSHSPIHEGADIIGVAVIAQDLTERVTSEQRLAAKNTLLSALINSHTEMIIFSLDRDYRYTAFNEQHRLEMHKVWNAEIQPGMNLLDCMSKPELRALAKQSIDRALKGETIVEIQHQPGLDVFYELTWNPICQDKQIIGVVAFIRNITAQKKTEAQILKLNRMYATLSNVNQSIVKIRDLRVLQEEVVRITVEYGKFDSAFIAALDRHTGLATVAAQYGANSATVPMDRSEWTGSVNVMREAIDRGRYSVVNHPIAGHEGEAPPKGSLAGWMAENGFESAAAFPLIVHARVVGILGTLSREMDFFGEGELVLLDEMAKNIAFAMEYIESENERNRAEAEIQNINAELEEKVFQRTSELEQKNAELDKLNRLFVGRELRMKELKDRISQLEGKQSQGEAS